MVTEYFKDIPIWDAEKSQDAEKIEENFAFCKDLSPLPVTRLESWRHFQQFIENRYNNDFNRKLIFRGQRRYDWKLISTLGRSKISNFDHDVEEKQLERFCKAIRGRIQDRSLLKKDLSEDEKNELWSIGQHHGLMTPLLDWTYSPYVALFFAFIEEDSIEETLMPNDYRAVYLLDSECLEIPIKNSKIRIFEPTKDDHGRLVSQDGFFNIYSLGINSVYILDSEYFKTHIKNSKIRIFEPTKDDHGRLVNQNGLFTISHLDIDIETKISNSLDDILNERSLPANVYYKQELACKVYIKNIDREECLQNLNYMNINHKSLFPDLHGSADFCNKQIASSVYNSQKHLVDKGSLIPVSKEKNKEYKKIPLYNEIKTILIKILKDSESSVDRSITIMTDVFTSILSKKTFEDSNFVLIPQVEILASEIAGRIERLKNIYIPDNYYEISVEININLILTEFDLDGLKPIQDRKPYVINKIMDIIKEQNDKK